MLESEQEFDNLTKISGIGPARQLWLTKTFTVRRYADLAALSAGEIEAKLTADGKPYAHDEVTNWIQEAAELAAKTEQPGIDSSIEPLVPGAANSRGKKVELREAAALNSGGKQWHRIALFQVEFQRRRQEGTAAEQRTLINYHDIDKWHEWSHIETEEIGQWIVEQTGDKLRPEIEEISSVKPEPEQKAAARLSVAVTGVRLYQPAGTEVSLAPRKNGRPYFGVMQANLPFALETDIELDLEEAAAGALEIPYQAQFYARDRQTGENIHLGDVEPGLLIRGKTASSSLTQITLPPGRYRLQVLVTSERENVVPGYFEVPILEVV